jgi:Sulfotransferase family
MAAFSWLGPLRANLRERFFRVLDQALNGEDGKRIVADSLHGLTVQPTLQFPSDLLNSRPYSDLPVWSPSSPRRPPIFITGRFRSGSTLLWNIFRHLPGCTAFYEPLNERRWFDPSSRGDRIDATHRGVDDYWREYEGLGHLSQWYRENFINRSLYMDAAAWDPDLYRYIAALIEAAPERAVLQFNRVDFRLAWLRTNFPGVRLIHLYRHPRDQWCSSLVDPTRFPRTGTVAEFEAHDHFYLLSWARDLSYQFPFLDPRSAEHPYDLFYMIWRLSYLVGRRECDASVGFEALCEHPDVELPRIFEAAGIDAYDLNVLKGLIVRQPSDRWRAYADGEWFSAREERCEAVLRSALSLRTRRPALSPLLQD